MMSSKDVAELIKGPIVDIRSTSIDDSDKDNPYPMISSSLPVFCFDDVKDNHIKTWGLNEVPKSADALHVDQDGSMTFIEFKNCAINNKTKFEVRRKMYESLLVFEDMVPQGLLFSHQNCDFILVFSEDKNKDILAKEDPAEDIPSSESYEEFADCVMNYAEDELIHFGLAERIGFCYRKIHTYNEDEFEEKFIKHARSIL